MSSGKPTGQIKSWKKQNEERKALSKEYRQQKLIKSLEIVNKLKEEEKQQKEEKVQLPKPAPSTVSLAVPGSILENAQSAELRAYLAGQVARAASIFRVNEIIVFDDVCVATPHDQVRLYESSVEPAADENNARIVRRSSMQLSRILQYLECPQYLRKSFFPMHNDLQYSGLINPLETPHHLRQQSIFRYREGVITDKPAREGSSYVNVGLLKEVLVDKTLAPGIRVTVRLENYLENAKKLRGTIVSPDEPRRETGVYWGYSVRVASSLSDVFTASPYKGGYDLIIGTSDRGSNVQSIEQKSLKYNHLLLVFGGLKGLEAALSNDDKLHAEEPTKIFNHYINVLPNQGSRTIRTEEALLIAFTALQEKLVPKVADIEGKLPDEVLPSSSDTDNNMPRMTAFPNKKRPCTISNTRDNEVRSNAKTKYGFDKRKYNEQTNDTAMENTTNNFKNPFSKKIRTNDIPHKKAKSNFSKPTENNDDFEVVSTTAKATNTNNKKLDLSRFD